MLGTRSGRSLAAIAAAASLFTFTAGQAAALEDMGGGSTYLNAAQQADWRQFHGEADHRGWNRAETTLGVGNVTQLRILWRAGLGFNSSAAVANGIVYAADYGVFNGVLNAYPAKCATDGSYCSPLWTAHPGYADWASPAVAGGMVYMQTVDGLFAYPVGCRNDGGECSPTWTGTNADTAYTSPTVANGIVFVATGSGQLQAYDAQACRAAGGVCAPIWTADLFGREPMSTPSVAKGMVYIVANDGYLYAFGTRCSTGGGTCSPVWRGNVLTPSQSAPAVARGVVYVDTGAGDVFAFKAGCGTGGATCTPIWHAATGSQIHGSPAVTNDTVYVANATRLYAFGVGCGTNGALCQPLWRSNKTATGGGFASSPAVANGVVYIGTQGKYQSNGRLLAFNAYCVRSDAVCGPLWRSPFLGAMVNASPAVAHGIVYIASNSGQFYAFGLPPTS
jgi:hypothetical protein